MPNLKDLSDNALENLIDKLNKKSMDLVDKIIAAGRGHERYSDIVSKSDPLSVAYKEAFEARRAAQNHKDFRRTHGSKFVRGLGRDVLPVAVHGPSKRAKDEVLPV